MYLPYLEFGFKENQAMISLTISVPVQYTLIVHLFEVNFYYYGK